ncbi:MAG: nitrilase-related carbon-nitrogen hydrolase [Chloroflexota bacterium]
MKTKVAAIQLDAAELRDVPGAWDHLRPYLRAAAEAGARLLVLPEYTGLLPFAGRLARGPASSPELVPAMQASYEEAFSGLAKELGVYLAPGTVLTRGPNEGSCYHSAYLFGPQGQVIGVQHQTHLGPWGRGWGLLAGSELGVFSTEIGRIGFVIGSDVGYPEVSRILCLQGANMLVHPVATRYSQEEWMARLWREVQANQVFGVEAALVGGLWEASFCGRSAVHAPVEMTEGNTGLLAWARAIDAQDTVMAVLDYGRLQQVVDEYPIYGLMNHRLYSRYFPQAYEGAGNG